MDLGFLGNLAEAIGQNVAYFMVACFYAWLLWTSLNKLTHYDDHDEIWDRRNWAFAITRGCLMVALFLGMGGSLWRSGRETWGEDILVFIQDGALVLGTLALATLLIDKVIMPRVKNGAEIHAGNLAVGVAQGSAYLAMGMVLFGSFSSDGGGVWSALLFSAVGMACLLLAFWLYEWVTSCSVDRQLSDGNVAAGIEAGGMLVAVGVMLMVSITGPFRGYLPDLGNFALAYAEALALFYICQWAVGRWLLMDHRAELGHRRFSLKVEDAMHHKNLAVSSLLATFAVGVSVFAVSLI